MSYLEPILELVDIQKKYNNRVVLDGFRLAVYPGEMIAITGNSGSGKTTVLNIIGLLENPDKGEVKLFGKRRPKISSQSSNLIRRNRISYLFQNYALIDEESVNYNLDIPLMYTKKTRKEKQLMKESVLAQVGLSFPLKQRVYGLSGGEQQRLAIARLLLKSSDLILADEPTGSLDKDNRNHVLETLKKLNRDGKTVIIVTHDSYVSEACDRIISLPST